MEQPEPKSGAATPSADAKPKITFKLERLDASIEEAMPLIIRHHAEVEVPEIPLDLAFVEMLRLNEFGFLKVITVRDEGRLIGYSVVIARPNLRSCKTLTGYVDAYYLEPAYRAGWTGYKLLKAASLVLEKMGCKRIFITAENVYKDGRTATIFKRLGYTDTATAYSKVIR